METVDKRTLKEKWETLKWRTEQKKRKLAKWCEEHPQAAFLTASTAIGAASYTGKKLFKYASVKKEIKLME